MQGSTARVEWVGRIDLPIAEENLVPTASEFPVARESGWSGTLTGVSPTCDEADVAFSPPCGVCSELMHGDSGVAGCDEGPMDVSEDGSSGSLLVGWLDPQLTVRWTSQPRD